MELCERWWQCTQELLALEEHCDQKYPFVNHRPWWAFKTLHRKTAKGIECDSNLTDTYTKLNALYVEFGVEMLRCFRNILSDTSFSEQVDGCEIFTNSDDLFDGDESVEACWSRVHQIHAKCNLLEVCCRPASWCLKDVNKKPIGKAIKDSEEIINREYELCNKIPTVHTNNFQVDKSMTKTGFHIRIGP
ncbi:unnamed protein product [Thelazia callipaeda]|uniref:DUF5664 domain-containing protein n=1 Tax=Thelazia callipaeda TaxID=103827 RepID=A0A0N5CNL6_THECL|nr:unnamed protein product [Thelazia callipaeda]